MNELIKADKTKENLIALVMLFTDNFGYHLHSVYVFLELTRMGARSQRWILNVKQDKSLALLNFQICFRIHYRFDYVLHR